jgi:hypothetical protein
MSGDQCSAERSQQRSHTWVNRGFGAPQMVQSVRSQPRTMPGGDVTFACRPCGAPREFSFR